MQISQHVAYGVDRRVQHHESGIEIVGHSASTLAAGKILDRVPQHGGTPFKVSKVTDKASVALAGGQGVVRHQALLDTMRKGNHARCRSATARPPRCELRIVRFLKLLESAMPR
jgi:hypothetical protein